MRIPVSSRLREAKRSEHRFENFHWLYPRGVFDEFCVKALIKIPYHARKSKAGFCAKKVIINMYGRRLP